MQGLRVDGESTGGRMHENTHRALARLVVWCGDGGEEAAMVMVVGGYFQRSMSVGTEPRRKVNTGINLKVKPVTQRSTARHWAAHTERFSPV